MKKYLQSKGGEGRVAAFHPATLNNSDRTLRELEGVDE